MLKTLGQDLQLYYPTILVSLTFSYLSFNSQALLAWADCWGATEQVVAASQH